MDLIPQRRFLPFLFPDSCFINSITFFISLHVYCFVQIFFFLPVNVFIFVVTYLRIKHTEHVPCTLLDLFFNHLFH